ncbi:hybrid-cluster NAD(P)-dependent oxidoreductase [Maricurvus nonylphenolicus]|uniref:FAD-binding oxidoreductase n=1 Tax=Maricurvus nonylphenolicus TaxID=1008307 RepID=UPI0036F2E54D
MNYRFDKQSFDKLNGIDEIREEIRALQKFNPDPRADKGLVDRAVAQYHPHGIKVRVSEIIEETPSCKILRLRPVEGLLPPFIPGQYINLALKIDGKHTSRAYSIASAPSQRGYYEIAVRHKPDGYVTHYLLEKLTVNEELEISAPAGQFYYNPLIHGKEIALVGGGSGITPFMSIVEHYYEKNDPDLKIDLIYGCADENDVIYGKKLQAIAEQFPNFNFHLVISNPSESYEGLTGFITADLLQQVLGDVNKKRFYLCGPEVMYQFVTKELESLGVDRNSLKREVQTPPSDPTQLEGWPEGISKDQTFTIKLTDGRELQGSASEPVLNTLERYGVYVPSECRAGECSICRGKVIAGDVYLPASMRLRKSDHQYRYVHLCAAYPTSDITIQLDV